MEFLFGEGDDEEVGCLVTRRMSAQNVNDVYVEITHQEAAIP